MHAKGVWPPDAEPSVCDDFASAPQYACDMDAPVAQPACDKDASAQLQDVRQDCACLRDFGCFGRCGACVTPETHKKLSKSHKIEQAENGEPRLFSL